MEYKIIQATTEDDYKICDNFMSQLINYESTLDPLLNSDVKVNGFAKCVCDNDSYMAYIVVDKPVGFVFAHLKHKKGTVNATNVIEVETLYIDNEYRRQGLARTLLSEVENGANLSMAVPA